MVYLFSRSERASGTMPHSVSPTFTCAPASWFRLPPVNSACAWQPPAPSASDPPPARGAGQVRRLRPASRSAAGASNQAAAGSGTTVAGSI